MNDAEIQESLLQALEAGRPELIGPQIAGLHPSETADLLESLPKEDRQAVWDQLELEQKGQVLAHAKEPVRVGLLQSMHPDEVARATILLDADDLADILNNLPDAFVHSILLSMDIQKRKRLAAVLSYPENTAGGLMNPDVVSVRADVSLDVVARYLRQKGRLPAHTTGLMVVDRENTYLGVLPLTELLTRHPDQHVADFLVSEISFPADTAADEVAKTFEQRDLLTAAVIDNDGKLLGQITVDDVVDVIQEQAEQTVRKMAGLVDHDMFAPVLSSTRLRAVWLGINLLTAFVAAMVVGRFEETIRDLVALAVLMPVVASMGGVAGSQTLNIVIRGLATGQLTRANARVLIGKELAVGVLNGLLWAVVVAGVALLWFDNHALGLIIGIAMVINLSVAALAGAVIPMGLKKMKIDPAVAGSVLLITVTDVVGFATFLGLATLYLTG